MSVYTKPILRFGLITPALFNCVLLAGALAALGKLSTIRQQKEEQYQEQTQRLAAMKKLESDLAPRREGFKGQKTLLETDPGPLFTRVLDSILPKYKSIELERSGLVFPLDRGRIAREVKADAARVKSSFQGGMGPMQETLLQVESLVPQAVLEELKLTRKADVLLTQREFLVLELTHTCWKAGGEKP